jgi:hypothetical protein
LLLWYIFNQEVVHTGDRDEPLEILTPLAFLVSIPNSFLQIIASKGSVTA